MRWIMAPLAVLAGIGASQAQPLSPDELVLHIETVGVAGPDAATVSLSIQGKGADEAAARQALAAARGRFLTELTKLGVSAGAVAAGEVDIVQDYGSAAAAAGAAAAMAADDTMLRPDAEAVDAAAEAIPQRASQTLTITLSDLTKLPAVEGVRSALPPDDVASYSRSRANYFTMDPQAAYGRAVQIALAEARREAEGYAAALGYRVVRINMVSNAKPGLNLPDAISMIGRAEARGTPGADEMKKLAGSVIAGAQVDYVIAPK